MEFYVYQLRLENSETPFYIGKGKNGRKDVHLQPWSMKKRSHKNHVIKKAAMDGIRVIAEILHDGLTEEQAHAKEIELIAFYGRRIKGGCLTNATDGGEGPSGYRHSEITRAAMAAPTAKVCPCPNGPEVFSMPRIMSRSGCPGVGLPHWRNSFSSSNVNLPANANVE
jgi:hypothetical protein